MADPVRQLPRGRHGLARDEVVASQRTRLAVAVVDAVAQYGYYGTTVAHIVRGARVSRETFYEHFSSKDACFNAAIAAVAEDLGALMRGALDGPGEPLDRLDGLLRVYLDWLVAHPTAARCLLLELRNAGPAMVARNAEWMDEFSGLIAATLSIQPFDGEAFGAAVTQLVAIRLDTGRIETLPQLREPMIALARRYFAAPSGLVG